MRAVSQNVTQSPYSVNLLSKAKLLHFDLVVCLTFTVGFPDTSNSCSISVLNFRTLQYHQTEWARMSRRHAYVPSLRRISDAHR